MADDQWLEVLMWPVAPVAAFIVFGVLGIHHGLLLLMRRAVGMTSDD